MKARVTSVCAITALSFSMSSLLMPLNAGANVAPPPENAAGTLQRYNKDDVPVVLVTAEAFVHVGRKHCRTVQRFVLHNPSSKQAVAHLALPSYRYRDAPDIEFSVLVDGVPYRLNPNPAEFLIRPAGNEKSWTQGDHNVAYNQTRKKGWHSIVGPGKTVVVETISVRPTTYIDPDEPILMSAGERQRIRHAASGEQKAIAVYTFGYELGGFDIGRALHNRAWKPVEHPAPHYKLNFILEDGLTIANVTSFYRPLQQKSRTVFQLEFDGSPQVMDVAVVYVPDAKQASHTAKRL